MCFRVEFSFNRKYAGRHLYVTLVIFYLFNFFFALRFTSQAAEASKVTKSSFKSFLKMGRFCHDSYVYLEFRLTAGGVVDRDTKQCCSSRGSGGNAPKSSRGLLLKC